MPIKNKNVDIRIVNNAVPVESVMVGTTCIYGVGITKFKIEYPAVADGTGFYIDVNGSRMVAEPQIKGELEVALGDSILVRTYAKAGYQNPHSVVVSAVSSLKGTEYAIDMDGILIGRATIYEFVLRGNYAIILNSALPAPKAKISINKDIGIEKVSIYCTKGAYESSGLDESTLPTTEYTLTSYDDIIQAYLYSKVLTKNPYSEAKEGYKVISTNKDNSGLITSDFHCTVTAMSQAGTKATLSCPPIPNGVTEYTLYKVYSEYSTVTNSFNQIYRQDLSKPEQSCVVLSQSQDGRYYFYKGDKIRLQAHRKTGYKLPSLGKEGDIEALVRSKEIVLSEENVLVVESGAQGRPVQLVNEQLNTNEYVLLNITSDYKDASFQVRSTQIFVGDIITIPLSPDYRVGTRSHRKPGVGIIADGTTLSAITFTTDISIKVPSTTYLTVKLQQGASRIKTEQFTVSPVVTFSRITNISPMNIIYSPINGDKLTPVANYGTEEFFLDTFNLQYSCKRYWLDAVTSQYIKITQYDVPNNFSYTYDCDVWPTKEVIAGNYSINPDGKGVALTVSRYDTDWVSNSSDQAKLIPLKIII